MNFTLLLVIIGVVGYLYETFSNAAKEGDKKAKEYRKGVSDSRDIFANEFEVLDSPPIHIRQERPKKKKKKKVKKEIENINEEKVEDIFYKESLKTLNYNLGREDIRKSPSKKSKTRKNPFNYTKNPLTNAVIASEILSKPKCKR